MVEGLAPPTRAVIHSHDTICRRLRIQYASLHMCGVNQFWIIEDWSNDAENSALHHRNKLKK